MDKNELEYYAKIGKRIEDEQVADMVRNYEAIQDISQYVNDLSMHKISITNPNMPIETYQRISDYFAEDFRALKFDIDYTSFLNEDGEEVDIYYVNYTEHGMRCDVI